MWKKAVYILVLALVAPVGADVLVLQDGESLSGRLVRVQEATLVFRTSLSGQMMMPMDTVRTLSTDQHLVLSLADGQVKYGRFQTQQGKPHWRPIDGAAVHPIDLAAVQEAMPIPRDPGSTSKPLEKDFRQWRSALETGMHWRTGNVDYAEPFARLEVSRDTPGAALDAEVVVERADSDAFPQVLRGNARLRGDADAGAAPYGEIAIERDMPAALDVRTGLSLGLYRNFLSDSAQELAGVAALQGAYEHWDDSDVRGGRGAPVFAKDGKEDHGELNLHLALRYARTFLKNGTLSEEVAFYPSLTDLGAFRAESETALSFPVTNRLKLRLDMLIAYDSAPEIGGLDHWDSTFGAGIRFDF